MFWRWRTHKTSSTKEYEDCSGYTRESQEDMWKSWGIISLPDHLMKSLVQKYLYLSSGHHNHLLKRWRTHKTSSTKEYEDCSGYTRESQEDMWKSWGIISLPDHLMKSLVQKYLYLSSGHHNHLLKRCLHNTYCSLLVVEKGIRIN
ncbi:hypothetical protein F2Q70_00031899 [Brassica cretica]|uniref:Uncharacterized protein n=1 Tax=Brassica cretica TaxID=69181 RepID=A0A8S9FLF9_BRACR|nr:hypothetical protein F2Q70_00031899 [Brassica cretica]